MRRYNDEDIHDIEDNIKADINRYEVPDSLLPDNIAGKISDIEQKNNSNRHFRFRPAYIAATIAACLVVAVIAAGVLSFNNPEDDIAGNQVAEKSSSDNADPDNNTTAGSTVDSETTPNASGEISGNTDTSEADTPPAIAHTTYSEIYSVLRDGMQSYNMMYETEDMAVSESNMAKSDAYSKNDSTSGNSSNHDYTDTDVQVAGVMEGDLVKTDGEYIYALTENIQKKDVYKSVFGVAIYKKNPSDNNADKIGYINLSHKGYEYGGKWDMYLAGNILTLTGTEYPDDNHTPGNIIPRTITSTLIYDISDPSSPVKLSRLTQSGSRSSTRMSDGYLYIFSNYNMYNYICEYEDINKKTIKPGDDNDIPFTEKESEKYIPCINDKVIPEDKLYLPKNCKNTSGYIVMTSIDINNPTEYADTLASLGWSDTYYVSNNNIYTARQYYDSRTYTIIDRYSYSNGQMSYNAHTKVKGCINDSYYMHEYKGNLVYVYTDMKTRENGDSIFSNGLVILDKKLNKLSSIDNLGKDETIYASYYIDNMAYFVTYRNTDPVFAVDISDVRNPKLKSELKLPGFSEYLHSFGKDADGNTLLIGIGRGSKDAAPESEDVGEDRVKISVFTVYPDGGVEETHTHLEPKDSYCETYDRHAIFIDEANGLIGYMLSTPEYNKKNNWINEEQSYVLYRYENNSFKRILDKKLNNTQNSPEDYYIFDTVRAIRIDNIFYPLYSHMKGNKLKGYVIE